MDDHLEVQSLSDWRAWLLRHHARTSGVWLVTFKKRSGLPCLDLNEAVEEALCFGWIDSKPGKVDEQRTKLYFAPRKPRTGWSRLNKKRIERMIAEGRMQPAGLAKIEAAKRDGSWTLLDSVEALEVPADLESTFRLHSGAAENFAAFPRSARRGILEWILQAKTPHTRQKRVTETASLAALNQRANQWPKK